MKLQQAATSTGTTAASKGRGVLPVGKSNGKVHAKGTASGKSREEMIRHIAYSYYEARNYTGGQELDDWLHAEAQVDKLSRLTA